MCCWSDQMIYERLPVELQFVIRSYFTVWQRHGFRREPAPLQPDPDAYFRTIRKCPRGVRMNTDYGMHLSFRRQRHLLEWNVWIHPTNRLQDIWAIEIRPQWDDKIRPPGFLERIMKFAPWTRHMPEECHLTFSHIYDYEDMINLEFKVLRDDIDSPPSRQCMAEQIMTAVARMANEIESNKKNIMSLSLISEL